MRQVEFCGHVLQEGKRSPALEKLLPLKKWELPQTVTQLRGFFGLANFLFWVCPPLCQIGRRQLIDKLQFSRAEGKRLTETN